MLRMWTILGIEMHTCVRKRVFHIAGTGASRMDVHRKDGITAFCTVDGKACDIRDDERSAQRLIE